MQKRAHEGQARDQDPRYQGMHGLGVLVTGRYINTSLSIIKFTITHHLNSIASTMQPLKLQRLPLKSALPPTVPSNPPPRHQSSATRPQSSNTKTNPPPHTTPLEMPKSGGCSGLKGILIILSFGGLAMLCIYAVISNVAVSNALEEFNEAKDMWMVTQTWHVTATATATATETVVATVLPTDVKVEVDGKRRMRSDGRQARRSRVMVSDM